MIQFLVEEQGMKKYLVYEIEETDQLDSMSFGMITNNRINGIAMASFGQQDTSKCLKYDISGKIPLQEALQRPVTKNGFLEMCLGIVDAILGVENYMISPSMLIFDLSYIFLDPNTSKTAMICLPLLNKQQEIPDLRSYFKNLVFNVQYGRNEDSSYIGRLVGYLNSTDMLQLAEFRRLLEECKNEGMIIPGKEIKPAAPMQYQEPQVNQDQMQGMQMNMVQPDHRGQYAQQQVIQQQGRPNMMVPGMENQGVPNGQAMEINSGAENEERISMFYLLQHYNKENAALYKEQKERKKQEKQAAKIQKQAAETTKLGTEPYPGVTPPPRVPGMAQTSGAPEMSVPPSVPGRAAQPGVNAMPKAPVQPNAPMMPNAPTQPNAPMMPKAPVQPNAPMMQNAPTQPNAPMMQNTPVQPNAPMMQSTPVQQNVPMMQNMGQEMIGSYQIPPMQEDDGFGETIYIGGQTNTNAFTSALPEYKATLKRIKTGEEIKVDIPEYIIGKKQDEVNYCISDNNAISRKHAKIVERDGKFYIVDLKSLNHTYVNQMVIQSDIEAPIANGTRIRLADEEFIFTIE